MKILVIQTASIGDVVLITPILEKLHKWYPDAKLDVCVKKGIEGLFINHPFLRKVLIWDKSQNKYKNLIRLANAIRDERYDVVVNCQRFASSGFLTVYSGAKQTIGFSKNPFSYLFSKRVKHSISERNTMHEVERNLSLISHLTGNRTDAINCVCTETAEIKLYPSLKDEAKMSPYKTQKYICIAPTSLWFTKQFPKERWIELIEQLDPDLQVYFLGSVTDIGICDEIIEKSKHQKSLNLAGKLSFLESVSLMRDAYYNLVNDSAPLHFTSATHAKVIVFFCSTVLGFGFGPRSPHAVIAEVSEDLSCRPCGLHGHKQCPKGHFKCAMDIDLKPIVELIDP
ncbi:MAG: glycosyltransferase family 9 protein [Bacteroidales bacterium]|nr:glycosyltransferase family 9 protein [Bacteroidales bacterium]